MVIRRLLSRVSRGVVLGLVPGILMLGTAGAHPAYANVVKEVVKFKNFDGKCLSLENVGPVIDTCNTDTREDWTIVYPNGPNDFLIQNDLTGSCLSILNNNTSAGAQVNTHGCDFSEGDRFELWTVEYPGVAGWTWIVNQGDLDVGITLAMHPSGCGATADLGIFMNTPGQCNADLWKFPFPTS